MNDSNQILGETIQDAILRLSRHPSRRVRADGRIVKREFEKRPDWPKELHEQYLLVLDERDRLQERIDALEAKYEPEPVKLVWRFACKHGLPNFIHCSECDG